MGNKAVNTQNPAEHLENPNIESIVLVPIEKFMNYF